MSDLGQVLPDAIFAEKHAPLLLALEERLITTADLISVEAIEIARRVGATVPAIRELADDVTAQLHGDMAPSFLLAEQAQKQEAVIGFLDEAVDAAVGGGIRPGYVTEIVGPSGVGKTQFLLMALLTAQLEEPRGLNRPTAYISTEHALPTQRLEGMLQASERLSSATPRPSLGRIITLHAPDLETQEHILEFQLPVAVERHKIGLLVIDSIAANYRAEDLRHSKEDRRFQRSGGGGSSSSSSSSANYQARLLSQRSADLIRLGALLRGLARKYNCAVLVANQVADRLDPIAFNGEMVAWPTPTSSPAGPASSPVDTSSSQGAVNARHGDAAMLPPNVMALDHQQRWFTGWGDQRPATALPHHSNSHHQNHSPDTPSLKTPTLGMVWTNQIACRISLHKQHGWARDPKDSPATAAAAAAAAAAAPSATAAAPTTTAIAHRPPAGRRPEETGLGGADWSRRIWRRRIRLVFAPWAAGCTEDDAGTEYDIWAGGLRSV